MTIISNFIRFWIDFIIGDSWEVAAGIGIILIVLAIAANRWEHQPMLGFLFVAAVIGITTMALVRQTAGARRL